MVKPRLKIWQIWNMSFGFLGIQFGWGLQMANMSSIYEYLGANPDQIPILWLAAPLTGLIVQPIIGYMSDRTWGCLGRRRPYFLMGALLSSFALVIMPNSSALWMAAGLLWILDASVNVSMEPFRAFVADLLPDEQLTLGFAMQSFLIGLGAVIASSLPWIMINILGISSESTSEMAIPLNVKMSFYIGACVFLLAVLWTIFTTKEYPPDNLEEFKRKKAKTAGAAGAIREIFHSILAMPKTMRQLALVQFFTWLCLFIMWLFFSPAVAFHFFGATSTQDPLYADGIAWGGICFAVYNGVAVPMALLLPTMARVFGNKQTHSICLFLGGLGLASAILFVGNHYLLIIPMICVGVAWSSILAMPYAILAGCLPKEKTGLYMGVFNFFIVLPQILAAVGGGWIMSHALHNNRLAAVVVAGASMITAAILVLRVEEQHREESSIEVSS
ncbi:MAG: MFS transporter [Candidatus Omnitrophota bacterium]